MHNKILFVLYDLASVTFSYILFSWTDWSVPNIPSCAVRYCAKRKWVREWARVGDSTIVGLCNRETQYSRSPVTTLVIIRMFSNVFQSFCVLTA